MPFDIGNFNLDVKALQTRAKGGIVTDGLVLHLDAAYKNSYPGGGTTWYDLSGNGNHGTMVNGAIFINENLGYIEFDGTNDYISLASSMINTGTGISSGDSSYTLEAWIYVRSSQGTTTNADSIIGNASTYGVGMQVGISNGKPRINYGARGTSNFYSSEFEYNQWTHIVLSRIAGTSLIGYINGIQDTTFTASNLSVGSTSWGNMTVGNSSPRISGYFDGYMSSVRVYNKGLSPDEVWQNYENTKNRFT